MTNIHMFCCCGNPPEDPCEPGCSCDSSYIISGIAGQSSAEWSTAKSDPCSDLCWDYDTGGMEYTGTLDISFTQGQTTALAKVAGTCCYRAYGELNLTYTFTITQKITCCQLIPPRVCTWQETRTGTLSVDFCYTVNCLPNIYNNGPGWIHSITICGFCIDNIQISDAPNADECADPDLCNSLPLGRFGLCVSGAAYSWATALKCFPDIQPNSEVNQISGCVFGSNCDGEIPFPCFNDAVVQALATKPFHPYLRAEFTALNPKPDPCGDYGTGFGFAAVGPQCPLVDGVACLNGYEYEGDCQRCEFQYGIQFPTFL